MTAFWLKIIAAVTMLIDHAGLLLFPRAAWMRCVGRIAFPIFAYCIAEGFRYTHSRRRYFLRIFLLGAACQAVYYIVDGDTLQGILLTFSVSILLMALTDRAKRAVRAGEPRRFVWVAAAVLAAAGVWILTRYVEFDYGFFGILLPVLISLFEGKWQRLAAAAAGLICLAAVSSAVQWYSLAALIPLSLYNGARGKYRMKYFFYVFYPAHLALLQMIAWVV